MIRIFRGSILDAPVDLIVNPANSFMRHGAGLARVIDVAAQTLPGQTKIEQCYAKSPNEMIAAVGTYQDFRPGLIPVGGAILGPPGALCERFQGIIHAVGPIWGGGGYQEWELLNSAYARSLIIARRKRMNIALPAISAGIFGVPIHVVADAAIKAAIAESRPEFDIYLALTNDEHIEAFQRASFRPLEVVTA